MWTAIKAKLIAIWNTLTTDIDWEDVLIHVGVGAGLTILIGLLDNPWYGAAIACTFFYAREQAQQGDKDVPPIGWRKFVPVYWGPHGQAEFLPLLPVTLALAWGLTWIKVHFAFHL